MGLKEPENAPRWSHPPKKKWIHCYLAVDEERKEESLKGGELLVCHSTEAQPERREVVPLTSPQPPVVLKSPPPALSSTTTNNSPYTEKMTIHGRRIHPYRVYQSSFYQSSSSPSSNTSNPPQHQFHQTSSYSITPVMPPANPQQPPTLVVSSDRSENSHHQLGQLTYTTASPEDLSSMVESSNTNSSSPGFSSGSELHSHSSTRVHTPNGFLRPNGISKSISPLSREYEDVYSKEDHKKRSGNTPSREVHNKLEKNRRAHLKECFEMLRKVLPSMEDKKISNQTILKAAQRYISSLKRREKEYEHDMERLARQKISYQQHLSALKKEISAKWDHIDFSKILPDASTLDHMKENRTKSTTTASENGDDAAYNADEYSSETKTAETTYINRVPRLRTNIVATASSSPSADSYTSSSRDSYQDPNQPLNLSTTSSCSLDSQTSPPPVVVGTSNSPIRNSPCTNSVVVVPPTVPRANGDWPVVARRSLVHPYATATNMEERKTQVLGRVHHQQHHHVTQGTTITKISPPSAVLTRAPSGTIYSTNHISPHQLKVTAPGTSAMYSPTAVAHISQLVKSGTTLSQLPKAIVTSATVSSSSSGSNHMVTNLAHQEHHGGASTMIPTTVTIGGNLAQLATIGAGCRVSWSNSQDQHTTTLPILSTSNGIHMPTQLVAANGTLIGQPAIQVITPDGYKLLPAEHSGANGTKPIAITLTHPGTLEHLSDDSKGGPVMLAVNKNGVSALHLARASVTQGNSLPISSMAMNLAGNAGTTVKVSQAATSLIPSYLPLTHATGITQLVQGMSIVGPIMVSQSQRGVVVSSGGTKVPKGSPAPGGSPGTSLVPAHYGGAIPGGLVNSVVVVSAQSVVTPPSISNLPTNNP